MPQPQNTDINGDEKMKVKDLIKKLEAVAKKYGANSEIVFDAGYNNVSVLVYPSKKKW